MKQIRDMIGINMGFTDRGNDAEYLAIIRAELSIDLRVLEMRLVEFFTKYPFDTYLGFCVEEVRQYQPNYERASIYPDKNCLGDGEE